MNAALFTALVLIPMLAGVMLLVVLLGLAVWKYWQRRQPARRVLRQLGLVEPSPLEQGRVWEHHEEVEPRKDGSCPNCYGREFYEGPEGGISMNVECVKCGCRWNANPMGFRWMYLGRNENLRAMVRRARIAAGVEAA